MRQENTQHGLALMLVIWVLAIFMVVVMSFSYATRNETTATLAFRDASEERLLAESCMERAFAEILLGRVAAVPADEELRAWRTDGTRYRMDFESGSFCRCMIISENGKVDINKAPDLIVKNLLAALGFQGDELETIADSIADWRDADKLVRLNGAEDDYYQSLPVPYKAKNAEFESIEELLMVRGMTPEILYGTATRPGLADFVTVYSENGKINISVAPREVLLALPGITADFADAIIALRKAKQNITIQEIQGILGNLYQQISPFVGQGTTNAFAVEAVGNKHDRKAGYAIKAIVSFPSSVAGGGTKPLYLSYRSPWETGTWKKETSSTP